jgi:hypothetical protein
MAKKARKHNREFKFDPYDDFDDMYDDDFDAKDLTRDFHSTEWGEENLSDWNGHGSARRKIERRNEIKRLYSELNDWEEFGEDENNYVY